MNKIVFLLLLGTINSLGQSVIPIPVKMEVKSGSFPLSAATSISYPKNRGLDFSFHFFTERIQSATGIVLKQNDGGNAAIMLVLNEKPNAQLGTEGYVLEVSETKVVASANTAAGVFYALQTILQLLPPTIESSSRSGTAWSIPAVSITDYPRFGWRGLMLDVSRHFFSKEFVKSYIDRMARYKFNRLHWHLTDDNGWRIEIKGYPKLTEVGAWRVPRTGTFNSNTPPKAGEKATDGGFYTQDDIREVVAYAKERFIEILPEVDVPGHSMAALAAYPELCVTRDTSIRVNPGTAFSTWHGNGKFDMHIDNTLNPIDEKVYVFLEQVFREVASLFPFEYIHMGGDECYKGYWERDASVQAFMKKNAIKNGEELQAYFNKRVNTIIKKQNKKMIGWDEILEGGRVPGATVMSWRGTKGGIEATQHQHAVVMSPSPQYYFDFMQGDASIEAPVYNTTRLSQVYAFDILAPGIDSTFVLGGQANVWTEQIPTEAQAYYQTYPRAFALAEGLWAPKAKRNWNDFMRRTENHFERFEAAGINYSPSVYDPIITVTRNNRNELLVTLDSEAANIDLFFTIDNSIPNQYHQRYLNPILLPADVDYFKVVAYRQGKPIGRLISLKTEELAKRVKK